MQNNIKIYEQQTIALLGGSGFVGKVLLLRLIRDGHNLKVLTRHKSRHKDIEVYTNTVVEQINPRDEGTLQQALADCDVVINLIGVLHQDKQNSFQTIHVDLVGKIVRACDKVGVARLIHVSAINANPGLIKSKYLRSKGEGENIALVQSGTKTAVTIVKPSVIFGRNDKFINMFSALLHWPFLPLACANAKLAPIAVGDVANIIAELINDKTSYGKVYNLCGKETYSLHELLVIMADCINSRVKIFPLGQNLSKIQASILGVLPGKKITVDNFYSLQIDATCEGKENVIKGQTSLKASLPFLVKFKNSQDKFSDYRAHAKRD